MTASGQALPDLGLQHERTALAWRRTGLAAFALGLLLLRLGVIHENPAEVAAALAAIGSSAAIAGAGRAAASGEAHRRRALLTCTAGMTALGAATAASVLLG